MDYPELFKDLLLDKPEGMFQGIKELRLILEDANNGDVNTMKIYNDIIEQKYIRRWLELLSDDINWEDKKSICFIFSTLFAIERHIHNQHGTVLDISKAILDTNCVSILLNHMSNIANDAFDAGILILESCFSNDYNRGSALLLRNNFEYLNILLIELSLCSTWRILYILDILLKLISPKHEIYADMIYGNHEYFFTTLHNLQNKIDDYCIRRSIEHLIGCILLSPFYLETRLYYVSNPIYLIHHLRNFASDSFRLSLDAFHIVKVFIFNPDMKISIHRILVRNKSALEMHIEILMRRFPFVYEDAHVLIQTLQNMPFKRDLLT